MGFLLERYCCCCRLRTGVLIIAWIDIILSTISIISAIHSLVNPTKQDVEEFQRDWGHHISDAERDQRELMEKYRYSLIISAIITGLLGLLPNILMIVGVKKNNGKYLIPWLLIVGIQLFLMLIAYIILAFFVFLIPISFTIAALIVFALFVYHYMVVYSLCVQYWENGNHSGNMLHHNVAMKV